MDPFTTTVQDLLVGDVVLAHGMHCLVTDAPKPTNHGAHFTRALVINRDDVSPKDVPLSFTSQSVWDPARGRWIYTDEHRWTLQGNDLFRVTVIERAACGGSTWKEYHYTID